MAIKDQSVAGYRDILTGAAEGPSPDGGAVQVRPVSSPEMKSLLGIAVAAISIAALYFARDVLIPITLAVMLSFVLSPVVTLLQRLRLWRAPAVILTVLAALGVLGLVGTLIGSQAAALASNAPSYARTIEHKVEGIQGFAVDKIARITEALSGGKLPAPTKTARPAPTSAELAATTEPATAIPAPVSGEARRPLLVEVAQEQTSPITIARTILEPILGPLETTIIVLIVAIFVLMQKEDLRDRFIRVFGSSDLHRTTLALDDAGQRLSKYFLSQLAVNTSFGVVIGLGLWAIGVPSPAMWGILAGLLRFVPYIGAFLAAVAPMALAAAIDPGWSMTIYVALLFIIVEPLVGYVVEPLLYGHSTGLSPVSVIVSAVFWTWLWGPIGLIMSTPLTLCLVVMGRHVKSLEFFDVLLGDRPALTAVESFYQRILANNPDEALAQAEAQLVDHRLIDYYDGVVLEGLKLAADDEQRGTIDRGRSMRMIQSMQAVIDELDEHVDVAIPGAEGLPARPPIPPLGKVVCISGRGPFDELLTAMLAQLLRQRGVAARRFAHQAVSRETINKLDLAGVSVIALGYLSLSGSPSHLRYLIRRLQQRAPYARIVVGLWAPTEPAMSDPVTQRTIGGNAFVGTLREAVASVFGAHARQAAASA